MTNDKKIYFWSITEHHKLIKQKSTAETQTNIWYFEESDIWATGDAKSVVIFWDLKLRMGREVLTLGSFFKVPMHLEQITGLVEVASQ